MNGDDGLLIDLVSTKVVKIETLLQVERE